MNRDIINSLLRWKKNPNKKPLILMGARQVGKTYIMKEFAKTAYKNHIYINFDSDKNMCHLFSLGLEPSRIIEGLELYYNVKISPTDTLIIFDEIQQEPAALASLKYFNEDYPNINIICAGSLLGVALHSGVSFPVGKVEFLRLYPLSFSEFLEAMGKPKFAKLLSSDGLDIAAAFKNEYIALLRQYYFVGGMPEAVAAFSKNRDFSEVRTIQSRILDAYVQDFSKHAPSEIVPRIRMLFESLPSQLAKENKKFIYGIIKEGARAKDYEMALLWLIDCGLVHKVSRISCPLLPLKAYEDGRAFKLYMLDVGLLGAMVGLDHRVVLEGDELFAGFKGALTEQYVLCELKVLEGIECYYWTNDRGSAELDFVLTDGRKVIPLEVKAETNLKAKSLRSYIEKFSPPFSIKASMSGYQKKEGQINLPLWGIPQIKQHLHL